MGRYNKRNHNRYYDRKDHKMENKNINPEEMPDDAVVMDDVNPTPAENDEATEEVAEGAVSLEDENAKLKEELEKEKREYLFLMAEFDNFRKRTVKEKGELIKNASESVLKGLLPIVDDFERGLDASAKIDDPAEIRKGMELIYQKLIKYLEQNGVKAIESTGNQFDAEIHEAIAMVPVQDESQKGIVIDTPTKGYTLNDKVLRHAKVVVGQ